MTFEEMCNAMLDQISFKVVNDRIQFDYPLCVQSHLLHPSCDEDTKADFNRFLADILKAMLYGTLDAFKQSVRSGYYFREICENCDEEECCDGCDLSEKDYRELPDAAEGGVEAQTVKAILQLYQATPKMASADRKQILEALFENIKLCVKSGGKINVAGFPKEMRPAVMMMALL